MGWNHFSPRRRLISTSRRPLSAKDLGYMLSALTPKRINRLRPAGLQAYAPEGGLDFNNIRVGDGSFSDGNGPPARRGI